VADARRRGRLWAGLLARGAAAVLLAAALVVGSTAVRVWQVARQDHRPPSDVIIVLGSETAAYLYYRWFGERPRASLGAV
jgi:hypothetical protein